MSSVMRVPWENRLSKIVRDPGGVRVVDALAQADKNLESIRGDCIAAVDEHLTEIARIHRESGDQPTVEQKTQIYQLGNDIYGMAGLFGLNQLGEAAFSLCELIDRLGQRSRWSLEAIEVHLAALRLFRTPAPGPEGAAVLQGLHKVTDRTPKTAP